MIAAQVIVAVISIKLQPCHSSSGSSRELPGLAGDACKMGSRGRDPWEEALNSSLIRITAGVQEPRGPVRSENDMRTLLWADMTSSLTTKKPSQPQPLYGRHAHLKNLSTKL